MQNSQQKCSDKLQVIDRATYEKLQQETDNIGDGAGRQQKIRNVKYKKTHSQNAFNLLQFVKPKPVKVARHCRRVKCKRLGVPHIRGAVYMKRGCKTREGGTKKHYTRLKKSILRWRQRDKQEQKELNEMIQSLENVTITQPNLHSRRFRDYCENCTTTRLGLATEKLLRELDRFQKRAFTQNETKARAHRRIVVGFREVQSFLAINKVKLVVIAPDCEAGLDETIATIKSQCHEKKTPYAFSLRRRELSYALFKKVPVSCVGVLDYDGAREIFVKLLEALDEATESYKALCKPNIAEEQ